ncbi:amino acid transporter [Lodderomyces elongisporus]|uniref:amino acid transporter n=1 Tax=Lodderomyces elongisporus TaxID=36914 RepID=UPI002923B5C2|nr:amino acid transporter [Lodderomyces elongisporus]WLF78653.1 amino acid transporter [Lodderomyces elongisporus]
MAQSINPVKSTSTHYEVEQRSVEKFEIDDNVSLSSQSKTSRTGSSPFQNYYYSVLDGFKRAPPVTEAGADRQKAISKFELRLMSLSTGLGTGLLVAAGSKLRMAGPAGVLIAYAITGLAMLAPMINSLSELTIAYSGLPGGFQSYYSKFIDESLGFALGWNYAFQWCCVISLELVTAAMTIKFWTTTINPDVWVTIFLVFVVFINFGGAKMYSVFESVFNSCKVLMLCGFVIFGLIIDVGGGPQGFIGGRYYHDPGAFTSFKGLASVFVTGAFSLGGSEFISLSASETKNPRHSIRAASKLVYVKVVILFLGSLTFVGLLVPYNSDRLMGSGDAATHASPYVLAAELHGVKVLPHIINAVILISVTSVATAAMYSSPRLMQSLAEQGLAPKWMNYIDKRGRPLTALIVTVISSLFAFIAAYDKEETVFTWLLSISGISFVLCWLFICVCHVRFRQALKYNGIPLSSLAYRSPTGVWGSYVAILINSLILIAQFWTSLFPAGDADANNFFENYLGAPVFLLCYIVHKVWTRNWKLGKKVSDIDVNKDRVIYDPEILELENEEDKERYKRAPFWKKALIVCFD